MINAKTRLVHALQGSEVDRPPFVCPGGMMNMVTAEVLHKLDLSWPQVYGDPKLLAELALKARELSGIENLGVPFCMTVEAEGLGAGIDWGSQYTEPRVVKYPLAQVKDWHELRDFDLNQGRIAIMLQAIRQLAQLDNEMPIIVSLTGPLSLATSLIEPMSFFRGMRGNKDEIHAFLAFLSSNLIRLALALAQAGADVLTIADPSSSGEILGPAIFEEFALPYINQIIAESDDVYRTSLIHICGHLDSIFPQLRRLDSPAISIDSATNVTAIKAAVPNKVVVGNVSTHLLQTASPEKVEAAARRCMIQGVGVLAPACGLSMSTPLLNLQAMSIAARKFNLTS
ncbi:MtaA/CmuA family methyltransferase [Syntrophomonas palmitatica]|uniref:MtaA/CmuA family methyltransferase n=1 Tax=Syntrophomonas palmitatica TaxID=402877 RepID=UPI0006D11F60|nr:MtaA/CmuA family methyltransferase [Syntrophomonas palmitatica]